MPLKTTERKILRFTFLTAETKTKTVHITRAEEDSSAYQDEELKEFADALVEGAQFNKDGIGLYVDAKSVETVSTVVDKLAVYDEA